MNTKPLVKEIIRFGVVGVVATVLHYGIYYFLKAITNVNVAYAIGYVISFIVNFYLTSYFTFGTNPFVEETGRNGRSTFDKFLVAYDFTEYFLIFGLFQDMGSCSGICDSDSREFPVGAVCI